MTVQRVLVLGAGATRAEAERQRRRSTLLPPLDRGFFASCQALRVGSTDLDELRTYMDGVHGVNILDWESDSVEQVMVRVVSDCQMTAHRTASIRQQGTDAFSALLRLYNSAIQTSTAWIGQGQRGFLYRAL